MKIKSSLIICLLVIFSLLFASCTSDNPQNIKTTSKNSLTELIWEDDNFIPGDKYDWMMSSEEFMEKVYGSERMNPNSDKFEEYRYGEMENGMLTLSPPTAVRLKDNDFIANTTYLFNEGGELIKVVYRAVCPGDEIDKYTRTLDSLIQEVDSIDNLTAQPRDFQSAADAGLLENQVSAKWDNTEYGSYIQITSAYFQDNLILDLILSVDNQLYIQRN